MTECVDRAAVLDKLAEIYAKQDEDAQFGVFLCESAIKDLPSVGTVREELKKAVEVLEKYYAKAMKYNFAKNPVAWAMYKAWMELERGGK